MIFAPLRLEAAAVGRSRHYRVLRTGMGPDRARIAAARGPAADGIAVAGLCAAVAPGLVAGDVVLASELRAHGRDPVDVPGSALLAAALSRRGLRVHLGPVFSVDRVAGPSERRALAAGGVLAVDMESAWLAGAAGGRPLAVLRVVVEAADRALLRPRTAIDGVRALAALRRSRSALGEWALALRPRRVLLAAPGSGADREIARESDVVLVAGPRTAVGSQRLVEAAGREGTPAYLVDDETQIDVAWLTGAATVGILAGASAPERSLVRSIGALGAVEVEERLTTAEQARPGLPRAVSRA